jgi:hypothetical protein
MRDQFSRIVAKRALSATRINDNTPQVSQIADTQNGETLTLLIITGTLADADATFAVTMEHGNAANLSDAAAVPAEDLIGTTTGASFQFDDDDKVLKIGYKGTKRYVRATITPANNTGNADLAAIWLHGQPRSIPQTTQKN